MRYPQSNAQRFLGPLAWLEAGRQLYARNLTAAIAIPLAALVPLAVLAAAALASGMVAGYLSGKAPGTMPELVTAATVEGYMGIISIVFLVLMPALVAGVLACFLDGIRGGKLTARHLRDGFRSWWACTWVVWLLECGTAVSIPLIPVLVGVPGIYALHTLMWLALLRIVDVRLGGVEALGFAWRTIQGNWVMLTLFTFIVMTLVTAGTVVIVGVVTVTPIIAGTLAAGYEALSEREPRGAQTA